MGDNMSKLKKETHSDEELRLTIVEMAVCNTNKTLERMEAKFDRLDARMDAMFYWIIGISTGTTVSAIGLIVQLFNK